MSYSNQMIVHAVDTMESYLNNKLPETKLWEHSFIKKQIDRREYQENFTIEDHIRGMVYSMLSSLSGMPLTWQPDPLRSSAFLRR